MRARRGATKLGCLVMLLLGVTVLYFGMNMGEVYLRHFRFVDAMKQEARFASTRSDDAIRRRLAAFADSLGLPEEAARVLVRRRGSRVTISAEYSEAIEFPLMVRTVRFSPRVETAP